MSKIQSVNKSLAMVEEGYEQSDSARVSKKGRYRDMRKRRDTSENGFDHT